MAPIFSLEDVHDLVHLFPVEDFQNDTDLKASRMFSSPFLLPSHSGDGFLISTLLLQEFRKIVETVETGRIPISSLSHQLNISADVVLDIVNQSHYHTIISADKQEVLTKTERDLLWDELRCTCSGRFISMSDFSHDKKISVESVRILAKCTKSESDSNVENKSLFQLDHPTDRLKGPFLCSLSYRRALDRNIQDILQTAHSGAEQVFLTAQSFSGLPPLWYISKTVKDTLDDTGNGLNGNIEEMGDQLLFKPQSLFLRIRDEMISKLQAGETPYVELRWFTEELPSIYHSPKDAETYIRNCSSNNIIFCSGCAISKTWLENDLTIKRHELDKVGYTDVSATLVDSFPDEVLAELITSHRNQFLNWLKDSSASSAAHTVSNYVVRTDYNDDISAFIKQASRNQAEVQWAKLGQLPQHECILLESEISDDFLRKNPDNQHHLAVFKAIFHRMEVEAKSVFTEELSKLEANNEEDFSAFWIDRVASRFQIYKSGAEAIEDVKLQAQLLELLQSYTAKELIPDTISRAQSKGLLRSKKTRRQTQKLGAALNTSASSGKASPDLQPVVTALEKFMKQQSIEWLDAASLAERKPAQVKELVRSMQKDTDGPRLFLTLIVVLLANRQDGIVYATGKLAPKLMKLLKGRLGSKGYERVEAWKDAVKAGKLTVEDQEEMKALAATG